MDPDLGVGTPALSGVRSLGALGFTWTLVERPTSAELDEIRNRFDLIPVDVESALDRGRSPGFWRRSGYIFVIIHVPMVSSTRLHRDLAVAPVAIFVRPDGLLTLHTGDVRALGRFFDQIEADETARTADFAAGVGGLLLAVLQRLVEAFAASCARLDHAVAEREDEVLGVKGTGFVADAIQLRREARFVGRLLAPLASIVRGIGQLELGLTGRDEWENLALRVDRLIRGVDEAVDALDAALLAVVVTTNLNGAGYLRALTVLVVAILPALSVAALLGVSPLSPLNGQPNGYAIGLAAAGATFLGALFVLKRRGLV